MRTAVLTVVSLFVISIAVFGQETDYSKEPGYVDFGDLTKFSNGEGEEVQVDANLLKMVANLSDKEDPELKNLLSNIKWIKVSTFKVNEKNLSGVTTRIKETDKALMDKKWNRIVKMSDGKKELTNVYVKYGSDGEMMGLAVTTIDKKDEAAFINIVGKMDLETIGKIGNKFDIPNLDTLKKK